MSLEFATRSCVLLTALVGLTPSHAWAAGPLRHALVLDERVTVEGSPDPLQRSSVEAALAEALLAKGVTLVDAEQSRAVRAAVDPRAVVGGAGLGPLTSADADVVVVGLVTGSVSRPLQLDVFGCSLNAQLRILAVDSGEVVVATSAAVMERDFRVEDAIFRAAQKLAALLAEKIAAQSGAAAERRLELHLTTDQPLEVQVLERLTRAIESVEGVTSVRVLHSQKDAVNFELRTKGVDTRNIALRLSEQGGTGLFVWGYSDRIVRARVRLSKALGLRLVPLEFQATGKQLADGAQARDLLPRALASGLAAEGLFQVDAGAKLPAAADRARLLTTLKKSGDEAVLLTGTFSASGERRVVSASLLRARDGKSVAEGSAECGAGKLTECMQELAARLGKSAAVALQTAGEGAQNFARRPVRVLGTTLADVYPSTYLGQLHGTDGKSPAADWVEVKNDGAEPIDDLELAASIPGLTTGALSSERRRLLPNETAKIPVRVVLDPAKLVTHDRNETTVLQLELRYRVGEFAVRDQARRPVTVYHRNAMSWADTGAVASFVSATSDGVQRLARGVVQAMPAETREDPLATAVALFAQLRGLAYVADPVNPYAANTVDYVQYPMQTLTRGAGDCDDLAVLYAAMVEAVGLPTLLVTTPGHIFVAVPTGSPAHSLESGISDPSRGLLQHQGRFWVPVETSLVGGSFEAAWSKGAAEVAAATRAKKLGLLDVRGAWTRHPPVDLSPPAERGPSLTRLTAEELGTLTAGSAKKMSAELERALGDLEVQLAKRPDDPELLNRKGIVLVALGRLPDAQAVFTRSVKLGAALPGASNNLGNLSLMGGDSVQALHWYDEAAQIQTRDQETRRCIVLNRLLAAWMNDAGGPRFLELVLGASDDDLKAFYEGVNGGPLRGSSQLDGADRSQTATRRSGDAGVSGKEGAPVPVARLVRWL